MNRALVSEIVGSLSARCSPGAVYDEIKKFDAHDWQKTLWWLSGSGLPHYLLARLRQSRREDVLPPAILDNLSHNFTANQRRVEVMAEEFDNLNRRLCAAGVQFATVRGFELAPEYCSDLSLRTWYTHEYFLSAGALKDASKIVEEAGYPFRSAGSRGELYFAVPAMQAPSKVESVYTSAFPRMVVLHSQVWDRHGTGINATAPKDVLRRLVTHHSHGLSFPTLADDDLLAFTLMDTFVRVLGYWCKLSWFLEISNFLRARYSDASFWESFYARIADCGRLPQIADFVFALCSNLFEVDLPEAIRLKVFRLNPALTVWIDHYGKKWALAKYPGSKLSLLVQRELIDDPQTWAELRRRRLFPFWLGEPGVRGDSATTGNHRQPRRKLSRVFDRIRFHAPATYTYLRELPRWKRLLAHAS